MEVSENYQTLKELFREYSNSVRNLGFDKD